MNNGNYLWFTAAVVFCAALLPTAIADGEINLPYVDVAELLPERRIYCQQFFSLATHCPAARFPLLSYTQTNGVLQWDVYLNEFLDAASLLGSVKTCEEFRNYFGCLKNMSADGKKKCPGYVGLEYEYRMETAWLLFKPEVETGVRLCNTHFNELNEHFRCVINSELIMRILNCVTGGHGEGNMLDGLPAAEVALKLHNNEAAAKQCVQDEIAKTVNCKPGATDVFKWLAEILLAVKEDNQKLFEALDWDMLVAYPF